uniref:Ig-like domain-containing protein n=1 Tax=Oryzias sinensis TaxID=183150 RepID=A0A8C7YJI7_9TELE
MTDSGQYFCTVQNQQGLKEAAVNLVVQPPLATRHRDVTVRFGGAVDLECEVEERPESPVLWVLPSQARLAAGSENGTLYLNNVSPHEEGVYTCYAENLLGKDEVKVRVRVTNGASPPRIQDKGSNTARVLYGETATLGCIASGDPVPTITWWSPSNRVIQPGQEKYHVMSNGSLVVQDAQSLDEGNYTCKASSSAGQDHKVTRLEVSTPFHVAGGVGHVVLPAPYHSDGLTVHPNGTLEMRSLKTSDSGQLVCFARKEGGEVRMVFSLDVRKAARMTPATGPMAESVPLTPGSTVTRWFCLFSVFLCR